jgi:hypothetical protein
MKNFTKFAALTLVLSASFAEAKKDKTKTETTTTTNSSGGTTTTTTTTTSTEVSTAGNYHNFIRQQQQKTNVIWDMPVDAEGESAAALVAEEGGVLFQLWTIAENTAADYLLDQKLVGAYLPKGSITIRTQDSYNGVPRIRVDQPFSVDFQTSNLVTGAGVPESASRVLAEHHLAPNPDGSLTITPAQAISGKPHSSGYIEQNGITTVNYSASSISAADPTKARGQEHFVLHALGDGEFSQTQLATAYVQVWPMTTGPSPAYLMVTSCAATLLKSPSHSKTSIPTATPTCASTAQALKLAKMAWSSPVQGSSSIRNFLKTAPSTSTTTRSFSTAMAPIASSYIPPPPSAPNA